MLPNILGTAVLESSIFSAQAKLYIAQVFRQRERGVVGGKRSAWDTNSFRSNVGCKLAFTSFYRSWLPLQGGRDPQSYAWHPNVEEAINQSLWKSSVTDCFPAGLAYRIDVLKCTVQKRRLIWDISPLISPSAEVLAIHNSITPKLLTGGVDQGQCLHPILSKVRKHSYSSSILC